ncbi:Glucan 1,3-beta-glucosidase [Cyphellophora attinorum]|uniref:Glucan 1,3-beta-glucosidase n=1 Tax=Cyphellophora attinorum TaxID=1664694 RepID=A0A0N1HD69_9EURO|nr:Glucan 1,3-beta-glucosidase [Phialophora attinorum]KPI42190.1 Glucan 1,3-beta-glucosidase [Phialophora attinorum]
MRPIISLACLSLASAIDPAHQPAWVKSVVASASSAYAPWLTDIPNALVKRQCDEPEHVGGPRHGLAPGQAPYATAQPQPFAVSPESQYPNGPPANVPGSSSGPPNGGPPHGGSPNNGPAGAAPPNGVVSPYGPPTNGGPPGGPPPGQFPPLSPGSVTGPPGGHPPFPTPSNSTNGTCYFWLEDIQHQGIAPYAPEGYQVFRNVKDFGAVGDGVTDDTAAINLAISTGDRCGPGTCNSSTTTPATVYFPAGEYLVSSSIKNFYDTQIIGNPNCLPVIKASANMTSWVIDSSGFGATNTFFRQIENLILDLTAVPPEVPVTGIFWPTAQATRLQNLVFKLSDAPGTQHQGVFISEGSGGIINDLVAYGGLYAFNWGNQQFTMSNLTVYNAVTAINQIWDWGFSYSYLSINNCSVGLNMSSGAPSALSVGQVLIFDSTFTNTPIGIAYGRSNSSQPPAANALAIENVQFNNVLSIVEGSTTVAGWAAGHAYTPNGPNVIEGPITPNNRPGSLLLNGRYYRSAKTDFASAPASAFLSVRSAGAIGDGSTDDTAAFQAVVNSAVSQSKILYIDAGVYVLTKTLYIPAGARITGEAYPTLLATGSFFADMSTPQPFIQIGKPGETGTVLWADAMISGRGALPGAIFVEYNLASSSPSAAPAGGTWTDYGSQSLTGPSSLWDVHVRIGGFAGSDLQINNCPVDKTTAIPPGTVPEQCIAGFMSMHITSSAANLELSANWLWTADHDIEDPDLRQITIFNGRGLYVDSAAGPLWLWGTAVEHHVLYEYQVSDTAQIFMGEIQTETAYYQPNPPATLPFTALPQWNDPVFPEYCYTIEGRNFTGPNTTFNNACDGWGLRVLGAESDVLVYGAGLYSFFANNNVSCAPGGTNPGCQDGIFSVEGGASVSVYGLNTVGVRSMAEIDGTSVITATDNVAGFTNAVVLFRTG